MVGLTGSTAQVAIKVFGEDLDMLDSIGNQIVAALGQNFEERLQTLALSTAEHLAVSLIGFARAGARESDGAFIMGCPNPFHLPLAEGFQ